MAMIYQHPSATAIVRPSHEALALLHRDELADGPTPDSIARAKAAQKADRDALMAKLVADPNGADALLWLANVIAEGR